MNDNFYVCMLSALSIYGIQLLKSVNTYAPTVIAILQIVIGIVTIIYLILKIKKLKS